MSKRTITIIIIIAVVIIGLAVALLLVDESFFVPKAEVNQNLNQQAEPQANLPDPGKGYEEVEPAVRLSPAEQDVTSLARNFAERYGSYSTDSNFANLEEVKILASAKLISQLQELIDAGSANESFYGVSSRALKVEILNLDETAGSAAVEVNLQRQETKEGQAEFVYYQKMLLSLIRSGSKWLVDGAEWQ